MLVNITQTKVNRSSVL